VDPEVGGSSPPNRTKIRSINSMLYGTADWSAFPFHVASCCKRLPLISKGFLRHSANPCDMDATWEGKMAGRKPHRIWVLWLVCIAPLSAQAQEKPVCVFSGSAYSPGATACECPSLVAKDAQSATGGTATISSRRLLCGSDGMWKAEGPDCLHLSYTGVVGIAKEDFAEYQKSYCPQTSLNNPDAAEEFAKTANEDVLATIVRVFCARFPRWKQACQEFSENN
jgi:hypothetical protein